VRGYPEKLKIYRIEASPFWSTYADDSLAEQGDYVFMPNIATGVSRYGNFNISLIICWTTWATRLAAG
jgi:hypothetical protein